MFYACQLRVALQPIDIRIAHSSLPPRTLYFPRTHRTLSCTASAPSTRTAPRDPSHLSMSWRESRTGRGRKSLSCPLLGGPSEQANLPPPAPVLRGREHRPRPQAPQVGAFRRQARRALLLFPRAYMPPSTRRLPGCRDATPSTAFPLWTGRGTWRESWGRGRRARSRS